MATVNKTGQYHTNEEVQHLVLKAAGWLEDGRRTESVVQALVASGLEQDFAQHVLAYAQDYLEHGELDVDHQECSREEVFGVILQQWSLRGGHLKRSIPDTDLGRQIVQELENTKQAYQNMDRERSEFFRNTEAPEYLYRAERPRYLMDSKSLTFAQQLGINECAMIGYLGLIEGVAKEELAVRLAYGLNLDPASTYRLIGNLSLHVQPELKGQKQASNNGRLLMALALAIPFGAAIFIKTLAKLGESEMFVLLALAGLVAFPLARQLAGEKAIDHRRRQAPDALITLANDDREPVLYLRSHIVDGTGRESDSYLSHFMLNTNMQTTEEKLKAVFEVEGPVVALEGPEEGHPNLGADRVRIQDVKLREWKNLVLGLMARATLVIVRYRPTEGTGWEVKQVLKYCPPHQVVIIIATPDDTAEERAQNWQALKSIVEEHTSNLLPSHITEHDYCLGFAQDGTVQIFGREAVLIRRQSLFLYAVIDAASFDNPLFNESEARVQAAVTRL